MSPTLLVPPAAAMDVTGFQLVMASAFDDASVDQTDVMVAFL